MMAKESQTEKEADDASLHAVEDTAEAEKLPQTEAKTSAAEPSYPAPLRQSILVVALMLAMFIVSLDGSIIATAIPTITKQFHSEGQVGWYGSAFLMCLAMFQGAWSKAYKVFSQKTVFLSCIFVFELGSLVVATAPNSPAVIAGRAVQGVGGAGVTSGCYVIVAFIVPDSRLGWAMGLFGASWACSSIIGPLLGGVLTQDLSWRWCFWINLPVGGTAFAIILLFFRTPEHAKFSKSPPRWRQWPREFDLAGIVIGLGAWICLLLSLQAGGVERAWNSGFCIGLLVAFCLLAIAFGIAQWLQGETAMIQPRLLKSRIIAAIAAYNFCSSCGQLVRTYTLPIFFQAAQGVSPSSSGLRMLPSVISVSITTFISSVALGKIGYYLPFLWVGGIINATGSGLYYLLNPNSSAGHWIGYQIVVGVGVGMIIQVPVMVAQKISKPEDIAVTIGLMMFTQFVGGGFGVSAGEAILNNRLIDTLPFGNPVVTPAHVLKAGARRLQEAFPDPQDLAAVVAAYITGLRGAWIFSTAMIGAALIPLIAAECKSIKKPPSSNGENSTDKPLSTTGQPES